MDFDGYEIDFGGNDDRPKRKNSKNKGKRGELALVKLFNKRFSTQEFSRVVGSGNRWSHVAYAKNDYIGDIVCPDNFRFSVECKFGYPDIELYKALDGGDKQLDGFLQQAKDDALRTNKSPLLCWKKDRRPFLAFVFMRQSLEDQFDIRLHYREWVVTTLSSLLALPDSFFFSTNDPILFKSKRSTDDR